MSGISDLVGHAEDAEYYKACRSTGSLNIVLMNYQNISDVYITKWEEFGISRDKTHAKLAYDWYGSWTTLYSLYADSLLCFHLEKDASSEFAGMVGGGQKPLNPDHGSSDKTTFIPKHIYKMQSDWYHAVRQRYGLPLDSRHLYTKTDWEFMTAAVSSKTVREEILESVALWLNETSTGMSLR